MALDIPEGDRPRLLESECGGDVEFQAEVEELLAAAGDTSWPSPLPDVFPANGALVPGDTIAHYLVESKLVLNLYNTVKVPAESTL